MAMVGTEVKMEAGKSSNTPRDSSKGARGAQFALQIALQTMKERCQQLQRRLATIEDENVTLKRQVARSGNDDSVTGGPDSLRGQVAALSLQKAQLSQQMQMVAAENRQLWLRLSRLYQANQSLGSHLSRISDTLKQHNSSPPPSPALGIGDSSLEEISLKLANSIMQEKLDLEHQCAQMAELQANTSTSPLDLQTLAAEGDGSDALSAHFKRLQEVRDLLLGQQKSLKAGIEALRHNNATSNTEANTSTDDLEQQQQLASLRDWGDPNIQPRHTAAIQDWTCPMCGQYFPADNVRFEVFNVHVVSHFVSDEEDDIATFDVIN